MSKKLLYLIVLVLAVTGTASADTWDITVPDAGFDDHVLGAGGYVYIDRPQYTGAWSCPSDSYAWISNMYYPDSLPALSPTNKVYTEGDIVYQILDERFIEGGTYTLSAWACESWVDESTIWYLYFTGEDYTNNLIEATGLCPIGSWGQASLAYTATAADAGTKIGIGIRGLGYVAFDDVTLSYDGPPGNIRASNPIPADGAELIDDWVDLSWIAGYLADEHDVYFGTAFNDVNDANSSWPVASGPDDPNVYKGRQPDISYYVDVLVPGTTYYWRIDEVNDAEPNSPWKGKVWSFWLRPWEPSNPIPPDGALYQDPNVDLSWSAGFASTRHDVFFGTDPCALDSFPRADIPFDPGTLLLDTTYYWQVEETFKGTKTLGPIWSFSTTLSTMGTILYEYWDGITPTGQSLSLLYNWPDFPSNPTGTMIFTSFEGPINRAEQFGARMQAWLYPPVTGDYKFWIATDDNGDLNLSTDENPANKQLISWVRPWAAPRNWADPDITPSGLIPLEAGEKYYIEGLMKEAGGGDNIAVGWTTPFDSTIQVIPGNYLEIYVQWWAWDPRPADGDPEASRPTMLSWRAGSHAAQHQVYFGTSEPSMTLQDTLPLGTEEYDPGPLDPGQTYYWKVNEVNMAEVPSTWEGVVWSFTTALCITQDDMEDYVDRSELRGVWTDGYASVGWGGIPLGPLNVASSGSNLNVSTAVGARTNGATGPIHGGDQAMVLRYDNDGGTYTGLPGDEKWIYDAPYYSEIEANTVENLGVGQDWTVDDVKYLSLWFQGHPIPDGTYDPALWPAYTQYGRGRDIQGRHDEFYYFSKYPFISTGEIKARVLSVDNTHNWAKAGIMIREKWTPYSKYVAVFITPGQGVTFQWRDVEDGPTQIRTKPGVTAPQYVKLTRNLDSSYEAKHSEYGIIWQDVNGPGETPAAPVVLMGTIDDPNLYIGTAVTSHNANQLCSADFNDVVITAIPAPTGWKIGNIGTNAPEQLYVALQDTMDNIAVVEHNDVNAATLTTWQEWEITLEDFVGVDMNSIKKIRVGLGDRDVPQLGGSGAIYIDDIRICPSKPRKCIPELAKPIGDIALPYDCIVDEKDLRVLAGDWLVKAPSDANLVGWWKLDDAFGATAQDSSIYGNHGTLFNMDPASDWITGKIKGALHFDGTNDYVDCGDTASLQITGNAISLAAWVKYETAEAAEGGIVMKTTDDWWADGYGLYVYSGAIEFYVYDWSVAAYKSFTADNQWHHVAGTYDGSNVRIWVDGVEGTPYSFTYGISSAANSLQIGRGASNAYNFAGALDDVRLYNAVLTEADILGLLGLGADLYEDLKINFKDYTILADHYLEEILSPY